MVSLTPELSEMLTEHLSKLNNLRAQIRDIENVIETAGEINIPGTSTMIAGWKTEKRKIEAEIAANTGFESIFREAYGRAFPYRSNRGEIEIAGFFLGKILEDNGFRKIDPDTQVIVDRDDFETLAKTDEGGFGLLTMANAINDFVAKVRSDNAVMSNAPLPPLSASAELVFADANEMHEFYKKFYDRDIRTLTLHEIPPFAPFVRRGVVYVWKPVDVFRPHKGDNVVERELYVIRSGRIQQHACVEDVIAGLSLLKPGAFAPVPWRGPYKSLIDIPPNAVFIVAGSWQPAYEYSEFIILADGRVKWRKATDKNWHYTSSTVDSQIAGQLYVLNP